MPLPRACTNDKHAPLPAVRLTTIGCLKSPLFGPSVFTTRTGLPARKAIATGTE